MSLSAVVKSHHDIPIYENIVLSPPIYYSGWQWRGCRNVRILSKWSLLELNTKLYSHSNRADPVLIATLEETRHNGPESTLHTLSPCQSNWPTAGSNSNA